VPVSFRGTFENRLDKKGRVSVPADFRAQLKGQAFDGIVAFPSLRHGSKHRASIDATNVLPDGAARLTKMLLGQARDLAFDGEGRIVLPDTFIARLGLGEKVTIVGQGPYFEIWDTAAHAAREQEVLQEGLDAADRILANAPPIGGAR